jgi:hypothetical protein
MTSIPQIDEKLQQALPAQARIKCRRLIAAAIDSEASFQAVITRQDRIREELGEIRGQQQQTIARARDNGDKPEAVTALAGEYDPLIANLEQELAKYDQDRQRRLDRRNDTAGLIGAMRGFLETCASHATPLAPFHHPAPRLNDGESPPAALRRIREQITKLQAELAALRRAALPSAELKLRAREYVRQLALAGTPHVMAERGEFRIDWPPGCQVSMGTVGPGSAAVMAWLFGDEMVRRLDEQIERISGSGLSSNERPRREGQLKSRIAALERDEEAIVERYEAEFDLARRVNADPLAVLNLRNGLANGKAS